MNITDYATDYNLFLQQIHVNTSTVHPQMQVATTDLGMRLTDCWIVVARYGHCVHTIWTMLANKDSQNLWWMQAQQAVRYNEKWLLTFTLFLRREPFTKLLLQTISSHPNFEEACQQVCLWQLLPKLTGNWNVIEEQCWMTTSGSEWKQSF